MKQAKNNTIILDTKYDSAKSFYGKAYITYNNNNLNKVFTLWSYDIPVCSICKTWIYFTTDINKLTHTTMRHIREFIAQYANEDVRKDITKQKIIKSKFKMRNCYRCPQYFSTHINNFR